MEIRDIAVIGGGPVGIFAGFYSGLRGLSCVIIDKLEVPGGQLSVLYPEKYIYDIAGHVKIKAKDLVKNLVDQGSRFEETTTYSLKNDVQDIEKLEDGTFKIIGSREVIYAKTIIVAAGNGVFSPRKMGLDGEEGYSNIHYLVDDISNFKDKRVAIFGGGDSALDWALTLSKSAKEVSIIHRRKEFRGHDHSVKEIERSSVNKYTPFVPVELKGLGNKVEKIVIKEVEDESNLISLDVDEVIVTYGFTSNLGPIENWNLNLQNKKILVDSTQKTSREGIFAVGDICTYEGKAHLIIAGMGEVPTAVNSCYLKINPGAKIGPLFSSTAVKKK